MEKKVVYCIDKNFKEIAAVSVYSLNKVNPYLHDISWIIPASEKQVIGDFLHSLKPEIFNTINLIPLEDLDTERFRVSGHVSTATYLRLFICKLINASKILYIDADTLILGQLDELFDNDLDNSLVAGVEEVGGGPRGGIPRDQSDPYINAGILLINLDALRAIDFEGKVIDVLEQYSHQLVYWDQCIINKIAESKKKLLPANWNVMIPCNLITHTDFSAHTSSNFAKIMHFAGAIKPWQDWCQPHVASFWRKFAAQVDGLNFEPVKITNLNQMLIFANGRDLDGDFQTASRVKGKIIQIMSSSIQKG